MMMLQRPAKLHKTWIDLNYGLQKTLKQVTAPGADMNCKETKGLSTKDFHPI